MRISVQMPSFLGNYPQASPNRKQTFVRAINSFLSCNHQKSELIIISDGCPDTIEITKKHYKKELLNGKIKLLELPRHELFTGSVRQSGIDASSGEIITQLDTDDYFLPHHLHNLDACFKKDLEWVFWNHINKPYNVPGYQEYCNCQIEQNNLNNASYAFRRGIEISWNGADGKHDNKVFLKRLFEFKKVKKIFGCGYVVTNFVISSQS